MNDASLHPQHAKDGRVGDPVPPQRAKDGRVGDPVPPQRAKDGRVGDPVAANSKTEATSGFWLSQLLPNERNTLVATFAGWALDGMDVMVYSLVIPTLLVAWRISPGQAGLLGTSVLVSSAVGGWLAGLLADRFGRTRVLQITIVWFALFTFLSGFTHSFWQLLITRGLQGLGFGGEWAVGSVLMGETVRARHRGKAVGTVQSGWAIGWGIAAICYVVLFSRVPATLAWRLMFWIGILPALLVFYIRRYVPEPEIFQRTRKQEASRGESSHFLEIFSPRLLRITLPASLLSLGVQGGYHAITTWLPTWLQASRGLSVMKVGGNLALVISGAFFGYLTAAGLTDRLGRKRTLVLFAAGSFLTVIAYTYLHTGPQVALVLGFPLGFFPSGSFSPVGSFLTELFPSRLRGSGQGFCYSFGRGIGALFPALVGLLSARVGLGNAIASFAGAAYLVMIVAVLLLPETRGKELRVYE